MIDAPIDRDPHDDYIIRAFEKGEGGKPATTLYQVKETRNQVSLAASADAYRPHPPDTYPFTIYRLHALVGDKRYPYTERSVRKRTHPSLHPLPLRHMLHSSNLSFLHPLTGETLTFESDMPGDIASRLERLLIPIFGGVDLLIR